MSRYEVATVNQAYIYTREWAVLGAPLHSNVVYVYIALYEANVVCCAMLRLKQIGLGCNPFVKEDTVCIHLLECAVNEEAA